MGKEISMNLSVDSIENAIKEIEAYRDSLSRKTEEFVSKLARKGIPVINSNYNDAKRTQDSRGVESGSNTTHTTHISINSTNGVSNAALITEGQDILFIEFGAGVYHNGPAGSSPHPLGEQFGYTIGSYGKGYGKFKAWGYYSGDDLILTRGTKATMPIYKASREIRRELITVAKEVFGGSE